MTYLPGINCLNTDFAQKVEVEELIKTFLRKVVVVPESDGVVARLPDATVPAHSLSL